MPAFAARCCPRVGEEEGNGAGGEIGHDPLQTLGWTWTSFNSIVACAASTVGESGGHAMVEACLVLGAAPPC